MARNTAKLTNGDFSGDEEGTSVTVMTSCVDWCPNRSLYRPLGTSAMAHGGSAMAHGGAPTNPGARYPDKVRISFQ